MFDFPHACHAQVHIAAADGRPDLSLSTGKHEALVYVWYVRVEEYED